MDEMLAPAKVAGELAYLDRAYSGGFERPYGWAWLLALHAEAQRHEAEWADHLEPLALAFAERFKSYLPRLTYPVRTGTHFNTAFAMILALDWADANDGALAALDSRPRGGLLWRRPRLSGLGAGRRRFPVAGADRGLADAPDLARSGLSRLVRRFPARSRRPHSAEPVHARLRLGPDGRQDRPSRRGQPQPRLVLARARRGAGAGACRAGAGDCRWSISTPACPTSPAIIWASIGWRPSRCWRWKRETEQVLRTASRPARQPLGARQLRQLYPRNRRTSIAERFKGSHPWGGKVLPAGSGRSSTVARSCIDRQ